MMTQPKTSRIPAPIYAAAGAGELALQQLRKLPAVVTDLGTKVVADLGGKAVVTGVELRQKANDTLRTANLTAEGLREKAVPAELDLKRLREAADLERLREVADLDRLRALATRNAAVVVAGAQAAQERAQAAYVALVARGERVVGAGVLEAAETVNADIEATGAGAVAKPAAVRSVTADVPTPAVTTDVPTPAVTDEVPTPADVAEVLEAKPAAAKKATTRATKAAKAAAEPTATPSAKLPRATKRTRPAAE
ncbi:hypothetical protein RM555_11950 [Micromonospora sp. DSM 115977]|uniref:Heparin binding hemagglutinin HbhA n=1 Tax=Micromonospora reichwaldensis TaxID=3075516 RepID=A0ABU2WV06_9ACTN|nr:hypothetical protein [Micromonospora sp. DSM 115977]MDT0529701.1 hypothetical protein [Micromonospora sp. DSM 115977]